MRTVVSPGCALMRHAHLEVLAQRTGEQVQGLRATLGGGRPFVMPCHLELSGDERLFGGGPSGRWVPHNKEIGGLDGPSSTLLRTGRPRAHGLKRNAIAPRAG